MEQQRQCRNDRAGHRRNALAGVPDAALDDLRVIRETMERSASFTAVSGAGLMAIGGTAVVTALAASRWEVASASWVAAWFVDLAVAIAISAATMRIKALRTGVPLFSGAARRALIGLVPALTAGAFLSAVMISQSVGTALIPGLWLMLYGVAAIHAGAFSVKPVRAMGACFAGLGAVALVATAWPTVWLALGFGGLHLGFGAWIARKHGG